MSDKLLSLEARLEKIKRIRDLKAELAELRIPPDVRNAKNHFRAFVEQSWKVVEPGREFIPGWHIDAICDHLEAVNKGQIRNLIINIPPRAMKSRLVSVMFPAWIWIQAPNTRFLCASYADNLAVRDSIDCRRIIQSNWYQNNWGHIFQLAGDQNVKSKFENTCTGLRIATSVGGTATGEGGDIIIVDDPHKAKEAQSDTMRQAVLDWWDQTMSTRGNNPKTLRRIIVMQRLHEMDLSGHLLKQGGWEHLMLPAEFEPKRKCYTSIGFEDPRTEPNELLCEARMDREYTNELKKSLGTYGTAGQLQQNPAPAEGGIFKEAWFRNRYRQIPEIKLGFTTWDTAQKAKEENDETAYITWLISDQNTLLIYDGAHGRWETPEVQSRLVAHNQRMRELFGTKYLGELVEDKSSGTTLMQYIQREYPDVILIPLAAEIDKVSRARGVTPFCETGRVLFPDTGIFPHLASLTNDILEQLKTFPNAAHDDLVDVFVYGITRYLQGNVDLKIYDLLEDPDQKPEDQKPKIEDFDEWD